MTDELMKLADDYAIAREHSLWGKAEQDRAALHTALETQTKEIELLRRGRDVSHGYWKLAAAKNRELQAKLDAAQAQEPVATVTDNFATDYSEIGRTYQKPIPIGTKLYASPVVQQPPLTGDDVKVVLSEAGYIHVSPKEKADFINGLRHGEKAHGIGGQQP